MSPSAKSPAPGAPLPGVKRLLKLPATASTQDLAKDLARRGAEDWTLVWSLRQTAGRGRLDRRWHSDPCGLYFSLILKPPFAPSRLADFSLMTAEAAASAVSSLTGLRVAVKPPNDVMALDHEDLPRKVCGILAEACGGALTLDWLVVGLGINVNNSPVAGKTTPAAPTPGSLKELTGKKLSLEKMLRAFLAEFRRRYQGFESPPAGEK